MLSSYLAMQNAILARNMAVSGMMRASDSMMSQVSFGNSQPLKPSFAQALAEDKAELQIKADETKISVLQKIIDAINNNTISSKQAKEIFNESLSTNKEPKFFISNNTQVSNKDELETIIDNILSNNPKQIEDYKNGKTNLFDYFVGQVMKETKGKANPVMTKEILKDKLDC